MRSSLHETRRRVSPFIRSEDQGSDRKHRPDYGILVLISILLLWGAVVVYAIGPGLTRTNDLPTNYFSSKQLVAIVLGVIAFGAASMVTVRRWLSLRYGLVAVALTAGVAVRFIGEKINGAHRWIEVGGFSFQVAEFIKLALVLWLAAFLSERRRPVH